MAGLYPRSDQLFTTMRKHSRGEITKQELLSAAQKECREIAEIQKKAGMTLLIEGQLLWHDHFRPFSETIQGMEPGPLTRWFDNNMFYKKPIIVNELVWENPVLINYLFLDVVRNEQWKIILPEPFTFASMCDNRYYVSFEELVLDIAEIIARELSIIRSNSQLSIAQLSAPILAQRKMDEDSVEIVRQGIELIKKSFDGEILLHTFFNDFSNAAPWILDSGADILGMDLTATDIERLAEHDFDRPIFVGIVDSRNSYVEPIEELVNTAEALLEVLEPPAIHIGPSADLDFLPRQIADKKVMNLGIAYRKLVST